MNASKRPWSLAAGTRLARMKRGLRAGPFKGGFRVLITGPQGFERSVIFALADDPAVIAERVRETLEK